MQWLSWNESLQTTDLRNRTLAKVVVSFSVFTYLFYKLGLFLNYVEKRPGVVIEDPILNILPVHDVTWPIFILIYIVLFMSLYDFFTSPEKFCRFLHTYTAVFTLRGIAMYLLPLDPPKDLIVLKDPFVEFLSRSEPFTKDLFYSGHTSTLFMLFLLAHGRKKRTYFLFSTISVAILVLIHRAHYTIDVFIAPFCSFAAYMASERLQWYKIRK